MTESELDGEGERAGDDWARMTALAIADEMTGHGLDVRSPGWDGSEYLKVTNVPGMVCEVWVAANGLVEWECSPCAGRLADPACTVGMVLGILGAVGGGPAVVGLAARHAPGCRCTVSLEGAAGRVLAGRGMRVAVRAYPDEELFEVHSEIEVTNPARPERGMVRVAGDGSLIWRCRARIGPGDEAALDPAQVAGIIACALTRPAGQARCRQTARRPRAGEFTRPAGRPGQPCQGRLRGRYLFSLGLEELT